MSTSDEARRDVLRHYMRNSLICFAVSALFMLFGGVYEYFSHGVWSYYMVYAFVPAFLAGALHLVCFVRGVGVYKRFSGCMFHSCVATLTAGSVFAGVLEIYGTENVLLAVYPVVAAVFAVLAVIGLFVKQQSC